MDAFGYKFMDPLFLDSYKSMDALSLRADRPLQVESIASGVVLPCREDLPGKPAGVLYENGEYAELSRFEALSPVDAWGGAYTPEGEPEFEDKAVVYMGRFFPHWGHFLLDLVSRLWYVIGREADVTLVYDGPCEIDGIYLEFMRLLGLKKEQFVKIEKPTRFREVILPECAHKPGILWHEDFGRIFDRVAEQALSEQPVHHGTKKIYFTRRKLSLRFPIEVGEKQTERFFEENGYKVLAPEQYSLKEQIAMLRDADYVACISGTLPHNMVFARKKTHLIMVRKTNKPNYRQVTVNAMRELRVVNVDAHISPLPVGPGGPFILDINGNVRRFAKKAGYSVSLSRPAAWVLRKLHLAWYIPFFVIRNRKRHDHVPVFENGRFTESREADRALFQFYFKRCL